MTIELHCRRCGRIFTTDRAAILAGPHLWRLCPECRDPSPPGGLAGGAPDRPPLGAGGLSQSSTELETIRGAIEELVVTDLPMTGNGFIYWSSQRTVQALGRCNGGHRTSGQAPSAPNQRHAAGWLRRAGRAVRIPSPQPERMRRGMRQRPTGNLAADPAARSRDVAQLRSEG